MPTATIISALVIVGALVVLAVRHRPGAADGDRWGDPPEPAAGVGALAEAGRSPRNRPRRPRTSTKWPATAFADVDDGAADTTTVLVADTTRDATA